MVSQAIADAVASDHWDKSNQSTPNKIVIGYDTRFLSDRFAGEVARVLAANGFTLLLAQSDSPTPAISYAVKHHNAIAGVMITASHNAPRYNGVKLKGAFGGSALPEQCRRVEVYINDNEEQARGPNLMDFKKAREAGLIQRFNPLPVILNICGHLLTQTSSLIIRSVSWQMPCMAQGAA
jgi:phosphomannomutase